MVLLEDVLINNIPLLVIAIISAIFGPLLLKSKSSPGEKTAESSTVIDGLYKLMNEYKDSLDATNKKLIDIQLLHQQEMAEVNKKMIKMNERIKFLAGSDAKYNKLIKWAKDVINLMKRNNVDAPLLDSEIFADIENSD